jgi:ubiquinone/menaquinone biosynthesis C-methylase UbiE
MKTSLNNPMPASPSELVPRRREPMPIETVSRYLPRPENTIFGKVEKWFRMLSYDIWRRELKSFCKSRQTSIFTVVDVGCGPGFLLWSIESRFPDAELVGIDQSEELLQIARSRCKRMTVLQGDASALPLSSGYADAVFALHVVEHLMHPDGFFAEARRILSPGGLLIVATPNAEGVGARIMSQRWRGYSDPTHVSMHGPSFWQEMIARSGFEIVRQGTTGLSGIPMFDRMPLGLIHWIPSFICGLFPWELGEAYVGVAIRRPD